MLNHILVAAVIGTAAIAAPVKRQTACSSYTIINTRGTGELQGESAGFRRMNSNVRSQIAGGKLYNTVYPADASQQSTAGTRDIVNHVQQILASNLNECFILEGYSQGAAATVNAMPRLTGASFDAVKGVYLIGNPAHKAGLACNVDANGGTSTKDVNGLQVALSSIPNNWVSKTLDVCNYGDGVCDTTHGAGINAQHLAYPNNANVQNMGTTFVLQKLRSGGSASSASGGSNGSSGSTGVTGSTTGTTGTTGMSGLGGRLGGLSGLTGSTWPTFGLTGLSFPTSGLSGLSSFRLPGSGSNGLTLSGSMFGGSSLPASGLTGLSLPASGGSSSSGLGI